VESRAADGEGAGLTLLGGHENRPREVLEVDVGAGALPRLDDPVENERFLRSIGSRVRGVARRAR
ncbi:hypothetical protein, partial [Nocardioides sp. P5_E3]